MKFFIYNTLGNYVILLQMFFAIVVGSCYIMETKTKIRYVSKETGKLFYNL